MSEREDMLAMVASLYYKLHQSQAEIAGRLGVSSSKVSRLLKEAWDRGIIEVQVRTPIPRDFVLEQELIGRYGLRDAYILETKPGVDDRGLLDATGQLAASYLNRVIPMLAPGSSIGWPGAPGCRPPSVPCPTTSGRKSTWFS